MPRTSPMEAMSSGVGHIGKDEDTMGRKILEPRAQPVLDEEEHQSVLDEEEPQLVVEEPHEPDEDEPKRVSVAQKPGKKLLLRQELSQ